MDVQAKTVSIEIDGPVAELSRLFTYDAAVVSTVVPYNLPTGQFRSLALTITGSNFGSKARPLAPRTHAHPPACPHARTHARTQVSAVDATIANEACAISWASSTSLACTLTAPVFTGLSSRQVPAR